MIRVKKTGIALLAFHVRHFSLVAYKLCREGLFFTFLETALLPGIEGNEQESFNFMITWKNCHRTVPETFKVL